MATRALKGVANKLDAWAAKRGLAFSPNKAVSMIFRKRNKEPMEIMLRNEKIPSTENIHFLRLTLYSRLNCEEYVKKLTFIAQRALNTIKVVAG